MNKNLLNEHWQTGYYDVLYDNPFRGNHRNKEWMAHTAYIMGMRARLYDCIKEAHIELEFEENCQIK